MKFRQSLRRHAISPLLRDKSTLPGGQIPWLFAAMALALSGGGAAYRSPRYYDREPLASMAHMCLTVLIGSAGGPREAASTYQVSKDVLKKLGQPTSNVGDNQTARKRHKLSKNRPHTAAGVEWIEKVIKAMIRRDELAFDPMLSKPLLTLANFPTLPKL